MSRPLQSPSAFLPSVYQMIIPQDSVAGVPKLRMHVTFPPDPCAS